MRYVAILKQLTLSEIASITIVVVAPFMLAYSLLS